MRADGSAKRYLLFSQPLKEFDREDLENLWKLVKAKHGNTRPEEGYERVLWGDLKTMFEHYIEDLIWRNLQGKKVLLWRLYDSRGVHFVRFEDMHVYMLVKKRYPLTPATITDMLNKKLKSNYWNEMSTGREKRRVLIFREVVSPVSRRWRRGWRWRRIRLRGSHRRERDDIRERSEECERREEIDVGEVERESEVMRERARTAWGE
ncbi:hypothetical protein Tco_0299871 [Tanacetum coccineum]